MAAELALSGPRESTPRREFAPLDRVSVYFQVYRKREASSPVSVTARVLDTTGRVVFERTGQKVGDYELELPIDELTPGRFLFEVKAVAGEHSSSRSMPFVVTP